MARTNIPLTVQVPDSSVVTTPSGGTSGDATNGHVVAPFASWPNANLEEITLRVTQGTGARVVTVIAGSDPPALEAGIGDLVVNVAADTTVDVGPFSSARFLQEATTDDAAGLWVDLDADTNTTIRAIHTPRTA